ncbi:hypothetical protein WMY93_010019 [Mugilogobius chulae]|uniref:Uncharacterized protein n=1 Tax=Mugilogobius chulae TaxID=88201 RepID=A0AAW0P694_9GOBI
MTQFRPSTRQDRSDTKLTSRQARFQSKCVHTRRHLKASGHRPLLFGESGCGRSGSLNLTLNKSVVSGESQKSTRGGGARRGARAGEEPEEKPEEEPEEEGRSQRRRERS